MNSNPAVVFLFCNDLEVMRHPYSGYTGPAWQLESVRIYGHFERHSDRYSRSDFLFALKRSFVRCCLNFLMHGVPQSSTSWI